MADAQALTRALHEAIIHLNRIDDLMCNYDEKGLPKVTAQM